jgi:hypothetical protein
MFVASAYPNSALSALSLMVIAFVMVGTLAIWLGLVFLADREPRRRTADSPASQRGAPETSGTSRAA